ncbi:MAG: PDZ domain-containing protein, partial [Solirubrobacterales bacterium]
VVKEVPQGSPGDRAGLQLGDIILACDGVEIAEAIDLPRKAASTPIGEAVEFQILRQGQTQTVTLKIGKQPS